MKALLAKAKPVKNVAQLKLLLAAPVVNDNTEILVHDGNKEVKVKAVVAQETSGRTFILFLKAD